MIYFGMNQSYVKDAMLEIALIHWHIGGLVFIKLCGDRKSSISGALKFFKVMNFAPICCGNHCM